MRIFLIGKPGLCVPCHGPDDELPGSFWNLVGGSSAFTGNERETGGGICTAAGGGMKSTMRDMTDSLEMWGIHKVYELGFGVQAVKPDEIPDRIMQKIHKKTHRLSRRIQKNAGRRGCNGRAKKWFYLMRFAHKHFPPMEPDYGYWEKQGWHGKGRPWKQIPV